MNGERLAALEADRTGASSGRRRPVWVEIGLLIALEDDERLAEAEIDGTRSKTLFDSAGRGDLDRSFFHGRNDAGAGENQTLSPYQSCVAFVSLAIRSYRA